MKLDMDWIGRGALALAVCLAPACSLTDNGDNDSTAGEDAGDGPDGGGTGGIESASVYDVQQGMIPEGTIVRLENLVVTSPVSVNPESGAGTVMVQEPEGGEYSGIAVFMFADVNNVTQLKVGDVVNVIGEYTEFFDLSEVTVANAPDIEVIGQGDVPAPAVVTPAEVATGGPKAEAYESVLIQIDNAEVTNADLGFGDFEVGGSLIVDDYFIDPLQPAPGTTFDALIGTLLYSFEEYRLAPRSMEDVIGGEGGFGAQPASIPQIRGGMIGEGTLVQLTDVVVTSPTNFDGDLFFVSEQAGGEFSGISVFLPDAAALQLSVGDVLTVEGRYEEFFGLSQVAVASADKIMVTGAGQPPAPMSVNAADISTDGASRENYEGVLVSVSGVTVTTAANQFGEFTVDGSLIVDNVFFPADSQFPAPAVDETFTEIIGVMSYEFEEAKLQPRTLEDLSQ